MRNPAGASAALLMAAHRSELTMLTNVALALEYEATCQLAEHRLAGGLDLNEVGIFIDALLTMVEPVETYFMCRPQLRDPADELVLEAAVNGQAATIVTFNRRDFGPVPVWDRTANAGRSDPEDQDMKNQSTYPLRLPRSVKAEVERRAKREGISVNQFIATAVAEKLAAMNTAEFFTERRDRTDFAAFDRLMRRKSGEPPRPDDRIP
jgi:predicted nucleic acid-binding protein